MRLVSYASDITASAWGPLDPLDSTPSGEAWPPSGFHLLFNADNYAFCIYLYKHEPCAAFEMHNSSMMHTIVFSPPLTITPSLWLCRTSNRGGCCTSKEVSGGRGGGFGGVGCVCWGVESQYLQGYFCIHLCTASPGGLLTMIQSIFI